MFEATGILTQLFTMAEKPENEQVLDEVIELRNKLSIMVSKAFEVRRECNKVKHENTYLQDYVGNLMTTDILTTKK